MSKDFITEPQKRFLRVIFVIAEEMLVDIKRLAQQQPEKHRLYATENSIPEENRAELVIKADETLKQIEKLADILGLERETRDVSKLISARLSVLWENFGDVRPKKLRGYGEVSPKLVQLLEPWLEQFNMLIDSMQKLTQRTSDTKAL